ncbi:increased DNA methylation 1 [Quillaja saponaria]|uniref:Increased DNA methylation 1 n=1 Tax=Quillaja saponaria TaxID=32244 RepID=A0AAD7PB44_QUISA|nr:increased DNA methylation 1 [Quillaja saponaria]
MPVFRILDDGNLSACCEQTNNGAPKLLTGVSVSMSNREDVHLVDNGNSMGEQFLGISASKASSLDLASLPDCGLDNTCILLNACRYNVPVTYGNCMSLHGGPETSSSREGDCTNSQRSDKQSSRHNLETLMEDEGDVEMINTVDQSALVEVQVIDTVGSYLQGSLDGHPCCTGDDVVYSHDAEAVCQSQLSEENVGESSGISECETKNACAAADVNMKKKVRRKCKKISEIKLSMLYQSDMLGSTFGDKVHLKKRSSKFKKSLPNLSGSRTGKRKYSGCQIEDDDLLVSAIIKNKDFSLSATRSSREESCKSRAFRKRKSKKGRCRLLPRSLGNGGKHFKDGKLHFMGARTVLSWLIDTGVISINDVIQYRNSKDDAVTKDGLVSRDGIICKCCSKVLTISEFKIHAGFRLNRLCLNLFMESGEPFTLCLLRAWSAEYKARKSGNQVVRTDENDKNDDSCGLCGDGGELICCDNCPSTFHQACLCTKDLPEGSWYCTNCTCHICGNLVNDKDALSSFDGFQCSQCERKYHEICLREKGMHGGAVSDTWFCGGSCQEVYSGLQSRVGFINHSADGFSWMLVRCIQDDQRIHSAQWFALKADCNSRLAVALTIMEECFLSMVDPRTGINMIPQLLYNWGSNFARLDFHGFYAMVLEKDDVIITVASIRVHGTTVAEMPLIATCSRYRRQGMCRRLMSAIEEMLMSFKVEKLVISAIPDLVETWTKGFGFKPVDDFEKQNLKKINLMVFPGTVLLKKPLYENQKVDQESPLKIDGTRQCPSSPLRTDGTTEVAISLKGGSMAERVQQCVVNTCNGVSGDSETKLSKGKTLPEPEATLEVDSNGQPVKTSLETEGPAEVSNCFRGEEIIEFVKQPDETMPMNGKSQQETEVGSRMLIVDKAVHQFSGNHCTNNNGAESEGRLIADQNIRVGDRVENTLQDHFSKLSCKTLGGSNHDKDLNVESSGMYDETQLSWEQQ